MEGNSGSPVKVHFMSTQFVGGMQYISRNFILPFELYRMVMEECKLVHPVAQYTELIW
jgi:hypothetical protein